ncbi:hypothetical protein Q604_UNBc4C00237G0002, partial [human gut metagenome]
TVPKIITNISESTDEKDQVPTNLNGECIKLQL